jgi:hypothetical protein
MKNNDLTDVKGKKYHVLIPVAKKYRRDWVSMFLDSLEVIAIDKGLSGYDMRVFLLLLSQLAFENYVTVPQSKIAKKLGIDKADVSRSMAKLVEKDIIFEGDKLGNIKTYRLNPNIGWRGDVVKFEQERKSYPDLADLKRVTNMLEEKRKEAEENQL